MPWFAPRLRRLLLWVGAVLLVILAQAFRLYFPDQNLVFVWSCRLVCIVGLFAIALLLVTTPVNAIRLRRAASEAVIVGVAIWLGLGESRLLAALRVVGCGAMLLGLRYRKKSAWWAVILAWLPV